MGTFRVAIEVGDSRGEHFLPVVLADGRRSEWDLGRAWVRVNGQAEPSLVIYRDDGQDAILGAYTLEGLRLAVDPVNRRLIEVPGLLL